MRYVLRYRLRWGHQAWQKLGYELNQAELAWFEENDTLEDFDPDKVLYYAVRLLWGWVFKGYDVSRVTLDLLPE